MSAVVGAESLPDYVIWDCQTWTVQTYMDRTSNCLHANPPCRSDCHVCPVGGRPWRTNCNYGWVVFERRGNFTRLYSSIAVIIPGLKPFTATGIIGWRNAERLCALSEKIGCTYTALLSFILQSMGGGHLKKTTTLKIGVVFQCSCSRRLVMLIYPLDIGYSSDYFT